MRKKVLPLLLFMLAALAVLGLAVKTEQQQDTLSDQAHVYTLHPDLPEWKTTPVGTRRSHCYVTIEEVQGMTTRAVVETVVTYPFIVDVYAFGQFGHPIHPKLPGIEVVADQFPPLRELMAREDAVATLKTYAQTARAEQGEDSRQADYAEHFLKVFEAVLAAGDPDGLLAEQVE